MVTGNYMCIPQHKNGLFPHNQPDLTLLVICQTTSSSQSSSEESLRLSCSVCKVLLGWVQKGKANSLQNDRYLKMQVLSSLSACLVLTVVQRTFKAVTVVALSVLSCTKEDRNL